MFSKFKVYYKPRHCQPLFLLVYALSCPLTADQTFEKWKEKIKPGIYLGIYPINPRTVALVLSLSTGRLSPQ